MRPTAIRARALTMFETVVKRPGALRGIPPKHSAEFIPPGVARRKDGAASEAPSLALGKELNYRPFLIMYFNKSATRLL